MENLTQPETEGLTHEQRLGLALVSLLTPAVGYAMGGKQGAMAGAQQGFTAAGGAAAEIGKEQDGKRAAVAAAEAAEKKRAQGLSDQMKLIDYRDSKKDSKASEPPKSRVFDGKLEEWDPATGSWKVVATATPKPTAAPKPAPQPRGSQYTAAGFGRRLEQSEQVFADLSKGGYNRANYDESIVGSVLSGVGFEAIKDPQLKRQAQAERNFLNAVLRKESGAAIGKDEFDSAAAQYFPRAGDPPEVTAQKAANRQQVITTLKAESGGAWEQVPLVNAVAPAAPEAAAQPRTQRSPKDGKLYKEVAPGQWQLAE